MAEKETNTMGDRKQPTEPPDPQCKPDAPPAPPLKVGMSPRPAPSPTTRSTEDERTFYDALRDVAAGKKITRTSWGDPTVCLFLHGGALHLRKADGTLHTLIVQDGDLEAIDWVVVREQ